MTTSRNRHEQRDARKLATHLDIRYTHALRLLREGKYIVRGGVPEKVKSGDAEH